MEGILDFSKELDITLLDRIVQTSVTGTGEEQRVAQVCLVQFQDHNDAWTKVDGIFQNSKQTNTKFFASQILEKFVQTKWNTLPPESKIGIRTFVVNLVINASKTDELLASEKMYLKKLNMVLVQILKQDWPQKWPDFIPEIVASSKSSLSLCENNMVILKLLSEEIFDFSAEQLTQQKTANLQIQMLGEFSQIVELCQEVLDNVEKPSVILATLQTLLQYVKWIPNEYIFKTNLIDILITRFSNRSSTADIKYYSMILKCLTEISGPRSINFDNAKLQQLFVGVMSTVAVFFPPEKSDLNDRFQNGSDDEGEFLQNLALFLTTFFQSHAGLIEQVSHEDLIRAHFYLVKLSYIEERELFKICLEYWAYLVQGLYEELKNNTQSAPILGLSGSRTNLYAEVLSHLRVVMIERMVKPQEVLVVENDEGEIVREFVPESDTIVLYKSMKEVLVYLTHLNLDDTEEIMKNKLARQMDGTEWSWQNLNQLCWAVGSISGAMTEEAEKRFLVIVIRELLTLCELKRGKDNKAVVASNIMYTVGQYPRFLKAHWKFLKTVVTKLFEFMHESHEGVQDMACDTFIKISEKCKLSFAITQAGESQPFVNEILGLLGDEDRKKDPTSDLNPQQIHTFYEAMGHMITAPVTPNPDEQLARQKALMGLLMKIPNQAWIEIVNPVKQGNLDKLSDPSCVKTINNVLRTNVSACSSVGSPFIVQLVNIYEDMFFIYNVAGTMISNSINAEGDIALRRPQVKALRNIKKEVLNIIGSYIRCTRETQYVSEHILPSFLECVLKDYQSSNSNARQAEVLNVIADIVDTLKGLMKSRIPAILNSTFQPTLDLITNDFSEYPDHRTYFYRMLRSINKHCFEALLELEEAPFKLIVDSIVWGFKHTMRDIADIGLQICAELIDNFNRCNPATAGAFYQSYFLSILQDIFFVLTDRDHKSGFKGQTEVLARLFNVITNKRIQVPLFNPSQVSDPNMTNEQFLQGHITQLLQTAFPHLQIDQIQTFVNALFQYNNDSAKLKLEVRDFLIRLKEFAAGENTELYLEEKEKEMEERSRVEREKALKIPGMIKPSELDEDEIL